MRRRDRWYVCIDHLSDDQLNLFGWYKTRENDEFEVYAQPYGADQQVVSKGESRFLYVSDFNDAVQMKGTTIVRAPPDDGDH